MPTIPFQAEPTVQPERAPTPYRHVEVPEAAFGGLTARAKELLGRNIEGAGNVGADIAIRFRQQQNETDTDAENVSYGNDRRNLLFGEGGFYTKKGKDAIDALPATEKAIEELRTSHRQNLKNPQAQRMFDVMSRRSTELDLRSMSLHAATENQNYRVGVAEASIKNAIDESTHYWNDPTRFARSLGEIAVQAENRARILGHTDPQQIQADVGHYTGHAWVERIKSAMGENPLLAKAMYEANKDQIHDIAEKVALEHQLKSAAMPEEAKLIARRIIKGPAQAPAEGGTVKTGGQGAAAAPGAPLAARDTKAQLANWIPSAEREAERVYPGNETFRDLVVQQVKGYVNTITTIQTALERQAHATVMNAAITPTAGGQKPLTPEELLSSPQVRQAWALLSPEAQRGFVSANGVLAQNAKEARGELVRSNPKLVNELGRRIYLPDGDPQKITSPTQLTEYRGEGLNHTDFEALRKEIAEANTPEGNTFLKQVNGFKQTARRMLLGASSGVMHPDYAEEAAVRFARDLDDKIKAERTRPGGDPQELFNPASKNYVLDINRVAAFMPSEAEIRAGKKKAPPPGPGPGGEAPKRLPGETPAAYLKRIGKD